MTWFRVDDDLAFHRKTVKAGNAAMGLWVRAGAWCAQQLNDGHVPHDIARTMGKPSEIKALVNAELWENDGDSYVFHDWFVRNPSRAEVEERRAAEAKKKADWRAKRAGQRGLSTGDKTGDTNVSPEGVPGGVPAMSTSTRPDPTRPDPSSSNEEGKNTGPRKRGTRIPDDFTPSEALIRFAAEQGFDVGQAATVTAEFIDYWRGVAGAKGVKLDWDGTWRNWIRRQDPAKVRATNVHPINGSTFTNADLDRILGPSRGMPQPPAGLSGEELWEWDQRTRREMRAARVQQANAKLGRSA